MCEKRIKTKGRHNACEQMYSKKAQAYMHSMHTVAHTIQKIIIKSTRLKGFGFVIYMALD